MEMYTLSLNEIEAHMYTHIHVYIKHFLYKNNIFCSLQNGGQLLKRGICSRRNSGLYEPASFRRGFAIAGDKQEVTEMSPIEIRQKNMEVNP